MNVDADRTIFGRRLPEQWWDHPLRSSRRIVQSLIRRRFGNPQVAVRFGGTRFAADLETPWGLALYRYGYWDDVLEQVLRILHPGDIFIDGGANVGMMTVSAAQRVGDSGRVIALEPAEPTRRILEFNVALGGHTNVTILPWALGDKTGDRSFVVMQEHPGLSSFAPERAERGTVVTVGVRTLDELAAAESAERVRLVKLDLEGAEVAALRGARRLLATGHADFIKEISRSTSVVKAPTCRSCSRYSTSSDLRRMP
jgi:FkbM family methyltransferase